MKIYFVNQCVLIIRVNWYKLLNSCDLKSKSSNYSVINENHVEFCKYFQIFNIKEGFNKKIYTLRAQKVDLVKKMWTLENKLTELHKELPEESRIEPPNQPQLNLVKEFPERQYQVSFETQYRTYSKISITKLSYLIYRLNKTVMSMISHLYIIDWSYLKKTIYLNMG